MTTPNHSNTPSNGGAFLLGTVVSGVVAVLHNVAKEHQHQLELQQERNRHYWAGVSQERQRLQPLLSGKDAEIGRLNLLLENRGRALASKDEEIARLRKLDTDNIGERLAQGCEMALLKVQIERQAKALSGQKVDLTTPLSPPDEKNLNGNGHEQK
jgi:hypothetical protein